MPSFDVVSKVDWAEVTNALTQAQREVSQRFDFKGTDAHIEKTDAGIVVSANAEERVKAAVEVMKGKLVRRKVSLKHLEEGELTPGPKGSSKISITVREGVDRDRARDIVQRVKQSKLKVQTSIQNDLVRVSGKKRDDLQATIQMLKAAEIDIELQFVNFRD